MEENPIAAAPPSADPGSAPPPPIPENRIDPGELAILREEILRRLDEIAALFSESHQLKDDRLLRLQGQRSAEAERRALTILHDLTRLHDVVGRTAAAFRSLPTEELSAEKVLRQYAGFEDDIEMLLDQHEVTIFREPGDSLAPQRQVASRIELTDDPAMVGRIAARLRPGFLHRDTLLVKERVAAFALPQAPAG